MGTPSQTTYKDRWFLQHKIGCCVIRTRDNVYWVVETTAVHGNDYEGLDGVISLRCIGGIWTSKNTSQKHKTVPASHCCITNAPNLAT